MLRGSINHVSITVRDLAVAMEFFRPLLEFLGFTIGGILERPETQTRLTVNINRTNGVAFNLASHAQVDAVHDLLAELGAEILDGPGEFPYAEDGLGYYAVYFLGPDGLKFECVYMPGLERAFRKRAVRSEDP